MLPTYPILFLLIHILHHGILAISKENELNQRKKTAFDLLLVTIATDETDGLRRLRKSAEQFDHKLVVFGLGQKWNGGDMRYKGGAQKVKMLRENLIHYKDRANELIILFVDAYDVVINADKETILRSFFAHFEENQIVFGAEPYCWPDRKLAAKYPPVVFGERYLNSGMFIGFADQIFKMLDYAERQNLADDDDDQLFYTNLYIDQQIRTELKMTLDSISLIFQNLNGAHEFVNLEFDNGKSFLYNKIYNTHPFIIHGNGPSKIHLNELANYFVNNYEMSENENLILDGNANQPDELPTISIAIFIQKPIPYVEEFLDTLAQLDFPKQKIHLSIHNNQNYNKIMVEEFVREWTGIYASIQLSNMEIAEIPQEHRARSSAIELAEQKNVEFLFSIDADVHLTNPSALKDLIRKAVADSNYLGILAPLVLRPDTLFSNFWGAVSDTGFYARSFDYVDIVQGRRPGLWNVPFVGSAILISARKFPQLRNAYTWNGGIDADIAFAEFCRNNGHFMYIDASESPPNLQGFLVNSDGFANLPPQARINLEIYDFPTNRKLWEARYIHPEYFHLLEPNASVPLGCPDVYDFPFLSERCCKEIIEIMEDNGKWSDGSHKDKRIQGGYENVPTRDIHMNQVGFDRHWLAIVDEYVAPIQEKVFIGFYQRPVRSDMMFVVRYRPDEQASLRPHHDASTWSIDIALNRRGMDYEGGGVRYIRYNCTVEADKIGWSMLFPGRLTHLHEGLPTTKGTRYILVSFINP